MYMSLKLISFCLRAVAVNVSISPHAKIIFNFVLFGEYIDVFKSRTIQSFYQTYYNICFTAVRWTRNHRCYFIDQQITMPRFCFAFLTFISISKNNMLSLLDLPHIQKKIIFYKLPFISSQLIIRLFTISEIIHTQSLQIKKILINDNKEEKNSQF